MKRLSRVVGISAILGSELSCRFLSVHKMHFLQLTRWLAPASGLSVLWDY
jgi:hypothetical protein